jgi:chromosome segregation ATPase
VVDDRAIELARRLEEDDRRLAASLATVEERQQEVAAIRERAAAFAELISSAPERRVAADVAIDEARQELERRRAEVVRAEAELAQAERSRDERRLASAQRALERGRNSLAAGERRLERATGARAELERELADAEAAVPALEDEARALSRRLAEVPRISHTGLEPPGPGLAGVDEWASRVAAALLVVRSGLETERERVIREANELAASVLGDQDAGTSVALARARLERAASRS